MRNHKAAIIAARLLTLVAIMLVTIAVISTSEGIQFISITGALLCMPFIVALYHEGAIDQ